MRILFMGTPEFAVPCLNRLLADGHEVCGVFTRPDRPRGRGYTLTPPPVAAAAARAGIPVFQPAGLRSGEAARQVAELAPQVIAVVAYGRILPEEILRIPPLGCINVHASLLPKYRGAAPIQWAIINGESVTGITTMFMAKGLDTGDIILQEPLAIGPEETGGSLYGRLAQLGASLLSRTLPLLEAGTAPRRPQDGTRATAAPMIGKSVCAIDFSEPAQRVHDRVRALAPAPGARTVLLGRPFKVFATVLPEGGGTAGRSPAPGTVAEATDPAEGIPVWCGDGRCLRLTQVQGPGGRRMSAAEYLRGHPVAPGVVFGR